MIKKLTLMIAACITTVPVVLVAAPPVEIQQTKEQDIFDQMVKDCADSYYAYKFAGDKSGQVLGDKMKKHGPDGQVAMALICMGYGEGFEDGRRVS